MGRLDDINKIMNVVNELKDIHNLNVNDFDVDACEDAGIVEYDYYELCYKLSVEMAKAKALSSETVWGYGDRHCTNVLEYALGKRLPMNELHDVEDYATMKDVRGSIMNVFRHTAIVKRVLFPVNIW
jgi:hypothetical protein